jgi:hypothetical protein
VISNEHEIPGMVIDITVSGGEYVSIPSGETVNSIISSVMGHFDLMNAGSPIKLGRKMVSSAHQANKS